MEPANLKLAVQLRHELHMHPELSNEEVWTKEHILQFIRRHTRRLEIVDRGNWFYAVYRATNSAANQHTVAFRADFDALPMDEGIALPWASKFPGKAHKCGHDGHSATLAAFALEVDQKGAAQNVVFFWQPGEEVGSGALQCVPVLTEERVTFVYGYHNMPGFPYKSIVVTDDVIQCASTGMIIRMEGTPAHASQPETGRNPSFAISTLITSIPALVKDSTELLLCTVVQVNIGKPQFGMSASSGELLLTIRAVHEAELDVLRKKLVALAQDMASAEGLKVSFEYSDAFPETRNSKVCVDQVREAARANRFEIHEMTAPLRPSEDFGHYSKVCPAAFFFIGNGERYPPIHTTAYDFRDEVIEVGAMMFKSLAGVPCKAPVRQSSSL